MPASWTLCWRVPPPNNQTILARTGADIFFASYCRWSNKWFLLANGTQEEIEEPQMWYCEAEYAAANQRDLTLAPAQSVTRLRKSKNPKQLSLQL